MYATERKVGPLGIGIAIAAGLVIGGLALSVAFWVLGMLAGIVWFGIRMAVLVGLAAAVVYGVRALFRGPRGY